MKTKGDEMEKKKEYRYFDVTRTMYKDMNTFDELGHSVNGGFSGLMLPLVLLMDLFMLPYVFYKKRIGE